MKDAGDRVKPQPVDILICKIRSTILDRSF